MLALACGWAEGASDPAARPNLVVVLVDDLGYGCVGFNGSDMILTPHLDRMAAEGMRLDAFYAAAPVCGPSRASLMFGQHTGRCKIRSNPGWSQPAMQGKGRGAVDLGPDDRLLPAYLKAAGYATGCFGKWGLNENLETHGGHPNRHGFDEFWGFNTHVEAHFHWPDYVWHNEEKVVLGGDGKNWREKLVYADDLFTEKSLGFIEARVAENRPFFVYLALTSPHLGNSVPKEYRDLYKDKGWPFIKNRPGHYRHDDGQNEAYAGMISHSDAMVGKVRAKLEELGVAENTLVLFTSDNGQEWGRDFFGKSSPFTGGKRSLYEGGIRMPTVAWWPGTVKAGSVSDLPLAFWDILPTFCELAGAGAPAHTDGLSFVPLLTGQGTQREHPFLYWYFNEKAGPMEAVRFGNWKAIQRWDLKNDRFRNLELYDLGNDPGERSDLARQHPEIAGKAAAFIKEAWRDDPNYSRKPLNKTRRKQ